MFVSLTMLMQFAYVLITENAGCECELGVCCDECVLLKGVICDSDPIDKQYACFGELCEAQLKVRNLYRVCDGIIPDCSHTAKKWGSWEISQQCTFAEQCFGEWGNFGYCFASEWCCSPSCDQKICGDDGCFGVCAVCPDGLACVNNECIKPQTLCELCFKSEECEQGYACIGYEGYQNAGGMCLPKNCVTDLDCPLGTSCYWLNSEDSICWVQNQSTTCINNEVWQANSCGVAYTSIEDCGLYDFDCFEGLCCKRDCQNTQCGDDLCGGSCGVCLGGEACIGGKCVECIPGVVEYEMCSVVCDASMRLCHQNGTWGDWSECIAHILCEPKPSDVLLSCVSVECEIGDVMILQCSLFGVRYITCSERCEWETGDCLEDTRFYPQEFSHKNSSSHDMPAHDDSLTLRESPLILKHSDDSKPSRSCSFVESEDSSFCVWCIVFALVGIIMYTRSRR